MTEPVKRYDISGFGDGMIESDDGAWYHADDYARLEQECATLRDTVARLEAGIPRLQEDNFQARAAHEAAKQLLTQCRELLDPHRHAELRRRIYEALQL